MNVQQVPAVPCDGVSRYQCFGKSGQEYASTGLAWISALWTASLCVGTLEVLLNKSMPAVNCRGHDAIERLGVWVVTRRALGQEGTIWGRHRKLGRNVHADRPLVALCGSGQSSPKKRTWPRVSSVSTENSFQFEYEGCSSVWLTRTRPDWSQDQRLLLLLRPSREDHVPRQTRPRPVQ